MNVLMKGCDMEKLGIKINDLLMIDIKNDIEIIYSDSKKPMKIIETILPQINILMASKIY